MAVHFILGGARSGKSARALAIAAEARGPRIFIATAQAFDAEMAERIARHRSERNADWRMIEAPLDLAAAIADADRDAWEAVIVVDCLTLWLSNIMLAERDIETESEGLIVSLARARSLVILVSNEVGLGIVPDNAMARAFRDAQGRLNQRLAAQAETVEFVAAGLPMRLKG